MNARPNVMVYGPQGSGKSRHAQALMELFGLDQFEELELMSDEELIRIPPAGALILTNLKPHQVGTDWEKVSIEDALARLAANGRSERPSAPDLLNQAAEAIGDRAAQRDMPQGERSMARTVAAFNALTGHDITERDGWLFMAALKASRATAGALRLDDYIDGAAYMALAGECAAAENAPA